MLVNSQDLSLSSYDYELDSKLIAQKPLNPRHDARLMVVSKDNGPNLCVSHLKVWNLLDELRAGDLLVINNTRVLKARLRVRLKSGAMAELLLLEPHGDGRWLCLAKPAKKFLPGDYVWMEALEQESLKLQVLTKDLETGGRIVQFPQEFSNRKSIENLLERYGEVPLPPYIRQHDPSDADRYQTRFASTPGSVAAPTAGLHLSDEILNALIQRGIEKASVTLHVGLGTFRPIEEEDLTNLKLHSEWVEVGEEVVSAVQACRSRGGRIFAVGTTTVRSLEASFFAWRWFYESFPRLSRFSYKAWLSIWCRKWSFNKFPPS